MSPTSSRRSDARRARLALTGAAATLLAACTTALPPGGSPALPADTPPVELTGVPFFAQTAWQCGPAALATVLGASGVAIEPAALAPQVYIPDRRGSLQVELSAATRRAGRLPWPVTGGLPALAAELAAGHPVLVLQDVGALGLRRWHYAVVVGLDPAADAVVLRSGRESRRRMELAAFDRSWRVADRWGLVVLAPGNLPVTLAAADAARTLAEAEDLLPADALATTWEAAAGRWPGDVTVRFGAANAATRAGDADRAERHLRAVLALDAANLPALNNLADLLLARDCGTEGRMLAARAAAASREPAVPAAYRAAIADTWQRAQACAGAVP